MGRTTWSLQGAKNQFSTVVEAARREPQTVTEHGKPAVVVIWAEEYARLRHIEHASAPAFVDHLLAMPTDERPFERLPGRLRNSGF